MESIDAIAALSALAQATRLDVFRLLVRHEPEGMAAGDIARGLSVPQNTLSTHLSVMSQAGLVSCRREGRSLIYRANLGRLQELVVFLLKDCCGASAALCAPLVMQLSPCGPTADAILTMSSAGRPDPGNQHEF